MTDLNEVAKAAVEDAFKDGVKARVEQLCSNLSSGLEAGAPEGMFLRALNVLKDARTKALAAVDKAFPP